MHTKPVAGSEYLASCFVSYIVMGSGSIEKTKVNRYTLPPAERNYHMKGGIEREAVPSTTVSQAMDSQCSSATTSNVCMS